MHQHAPPGIHQDTPTSKCDHPENVRLPCRDPYATLHALDARASVQCQWSRQVLTAVETPIPLFGARIANAADMHYLTAYLAKGVIKDIEMHR